MAKPLSLIIFQVCLLCLSAGVANKYTDRSHMEKDRPFRMGKVNTVWEKARKVLKDKRLTDLYVDLVVQDRKLKELKAKKQHGEDVDGLFEADVQKNFLRVLRKFNLVDFFPEERQWSNFKFRDEKPEKPDLRDEKLKKLWKTAAFEGFSDLEMETLKEELSHHQSKLDEFHSLRTEYEVLKDNVDNSLDNLDEQEDYWKLMEKTKREMKEKHKEIQDNYQTMRKKVQKAVPEEGEFKDPRVYHLWALAQKSGMSEAELNSIKKELGHFEHRIKKAEMIQGQVNKSEQKMNSDDLLHDPIKHQELVDRAKQYHAKVDKYHEDLKYRIQKRLDEL